VGRGAATPAKLTDRAILIASNRLETLHFTV
jgi:hypothetical protein